MITLTIIFLSLFFWFFFGHFCFYTTFRTRKSDAFEKETLCGGEVFTEEGKAAAYSAREWLDEAGGEDVFINSHDKLRLHGRLITHKNPPQKGLAILAHGYHSSGRRDLAIQAKGIYEDGYDILLISQRGHGKSEGKYLTFGVKERIDILSWCEYANKRFTSPEIALVGLSMGGATVLMASELNLPENVKCIVSDCAFSSPYEITLHGLRNKKAPRYPTIFFMNFWCRVLAHFDLKQASALGALKKNTRPILLFHGELDRYVPTEMSIANSESGGKLTELVIVPNARHAQSVYYDTDGYIKKLLDFLDEHIN